MGALDELSNCGELWPFRIESDIRGRNSEGNSLCGRRVEGRSGGHGVGRTPGHVRTSAWA